MDATLLAELTEAALVAMWWQWRGHARGDAVRDELVRRGLGEEWD